MIGGFHCINGLRLPWSYQIKIDFVNGFQIISFDFTCLNIRSDPSLKPPHTWAAVIYDADVISLSLLQVIASDGG